MKIDWGHTSNTMAVNCGLRWKVKTLVLTHHEPDYLDEAFTKTTKPRFSTHMPAATAI
jgi:ribonuclease BN (tRNA processing enzyme)